MIDIIVHEFVSQNRSIDPYLLHDHVSQNYPIDVDYIADLNGRKRKPPVGRAGSFLSQLVLRIAEDLGLDLAPSTRARHEGRAIYNPERYF